MVEFGPDSSSPLTQPFWAAARAGRLVLPFDRDSGAPRWYPREGDDLEWRRVRGGATLVSFTVVRGAINPDFEPPYAPALVDLDEAPGLRLVTQIVDCDFADLCCGMRLEVCFRALQPCGRDTFIAPCFRPA